MKILLAHRYDPGYPMGGAARFVLELAVPLRDEPGVQVACATNHGELADKLARQKITVYELPYERLKTPVILGRLAKTIEEFRPDLIHSHHRYLSFLLAWFFKRKACVLHTEHVLRKDRKIFFRHGHHATAVSRGVAANLTGYYGVRERDMTCIPNAVRLRKPDADKTAKWRKRWPSDAILGLCVGRLDEQKGHEYLLRAVSLLARKDQARLRILLAGDGPWKGRLKELAQAVKVRDCFDFLGHTDEVPELLHLCDVFLLPSLWEGLPLSVLEAYAAGKPVIATQIPGTEEIILQNKTGVMVPPRDAVALKDAIEDFLHHPSKFKAMEPAIGERAADFSFENMVARYVDLYTELRSRYGGT